MAQNKWLPVVIIGSLVGLLLWKSRKAPVPAVGAGGLRIGEIVPASPTEGGSFVASVYITNTSYVGVAPGTLCAYTFGVTMNCQIGSTNLAQQAQNIAMSAGQADLKVSFTFNIPAGVNGSSLAIGRLLTGEVPPQQLAAANLAFTVASLVVTPSGAIRF